MLLHAWLTVFFLKWQSYASSPIVGSGSYALAEGSQLNYEQPVFSQHQYYAPTDSTSDYQEAYSIPMIDEPGSVLYDSRTFTNEPQHVFYDSQTPTNEPQYALSSSSGAYNDSSFLYAKPNKLRASPARSASVRQGYLDLNAEPEV